MQHKRLFALAFNRINDLCVTACAERRGNDRLRLATRKD